jgi:predicted RNA binding protein YcfA (HicA-like mRNA interferase family)
MSKRDKLRRKLRNHPKGVKFSEIETLLLGFGFILARVSGSHHVFRYNDKQRKINIIVPVHGNQVKTPYIKEVVEILDEFFPENPTLDRDDDE